MRTHQSTINVIITMGVKFVSVSASLILGEQDLLSSGLVLISNYAGHDV